MCDKCEGSGETPPDAPKGVVDHAMALAQDAQSRGAALVGDAKEQVMSTAEGKQFTGKQDWIAQVVERGAAELGTLADTLRTNDLQGLMDKLQDLARRQPAIFVGAAMRLDLAR